MSDDVFEMDGPADTSRGGAFLEEPGTYHVKILDVNIQPTDRSGGLIPNAACKVSYVVLNGTTPGQTDKQGNFMLYKPDLSKSEKSQEFAKKKLFWFFVAVGLHDERNGNKLRVAPKAAVGRHFIVHLDYDKNQDGTQGKYLNVQFCDMFHIDDPTKAGVPKNAEALAAYPKEFRRSPESFAKDDGRNAKTATTAKAPTAPVTPTSGQQAAASSSVVTADDV